MILTVIIPCYNVEKLVERCIVSLLNQSFKDFQVVFIDDGSTDETEKVILSKLENSELKFSFIKQENKGPAAARNNGLKNSKSKYVCFLDSDDWLSENSLKERVYFLEKNPATDVVYSDAYIIYETKINEIEKSFSNRYNGFYSGLVFKKLIGNNFIPMPTVMLKRDCFDYTGFFNEELKGIEDYDMWLRLSYNKNKFNFIDKKLAYYLVRNSSLSSFSSEMDEKVVNLFNSYLNNFNLSLTEKSEIYKRIKSIEFNKAIREILKSIQAQSSYNILSNLFILLKRKFFHPYYYFLIFLFFAAPKTFSAKFTEKFKNHDVQPR